jgi:flagellar basal body-associated protein FliL
MADKPNKSDATAAPAEGAAPAAPAKGGGMKFAIVTVVLLVVEAAVLGGIFMMLNKPKSAEAEAPVVHIDPEEEKLVEVLVLNERLANDRSGLTFVYPTEIYVQVKKKHEAVVTEEIERLKNELRADIVALWRTAEPQHLQEPRMESMTRRVETLLRERFDKHGTEEEPVVQKCVIVSGTGIRMNR